MYQESNKSYYQSNPAYIHGLVEVHSLYLSRVTEEWREILCRYSRCHGRGSSWVLSECKRNALRKPTRILHVALPQHSACVNPGDHSLNIDPLEIKCYVVGSCFRVELSSICTNKEALHNGATVTAVPTAMQKPYHIYTIFLWLLVPRLAFRDLFDM